MSLFIRAPPRAPQPAPQRPFDPELSLTLQDKHELKLREFQQSLLAIVASPRDEGISSARGQLNKLQGKNLRIPV